MQRVKKSKGKISIKHFRDTVWKYYAKHKRDFPWRRTTDPYHILVSEVMLQQTQAPRVALKYRDFLKKFPTVEALAKAKLSEVLMFWQGLGYNRRAKYLWETAQIIVTVYGSRVPSNPAELDALPGIGPDTAFAICAYAFNQPVVFLETNIRTVFIYHFFSKRKKVEDAEIRPLVLKTLDQNRSRLWYAALMDYGAFLKKTDNHSKRSASYVKQSPLKGSVREVRGFILKEMLQEGCLKVGMVEDIFGGKRAHRAILGLSGDGLIEVRRGLIKSFS